LDDNIKAENAWQGALSLSSHRLDRLARLNQLTGTWGWNQERKDLLEEIMSEFPHESWAGEQLVALLYASGETQAMADLLDRMYAADPSNVHLENNLATVLLLLKSDLEKAHRLALESYNSSTNNPFYACTYAYSLLLQSRPQEAVRVIGSVKTDFLKNPSIAAYYGIVEANAGNENLAKGPLKLAESGRLLPEELKLVREAESRLQSRLTWNTAVAQVTH
jgi:predicted Zn-dependent protease